MQGQFAIAIVITSISSTITAFTISIFSVYSIKNKVIKPMFITVINKFISTRSTYTC